MRKQFYLKNDGINENGVLLVDKPSGWTSHDVVQFVRRFGLKKVGHCGTLDPSATGLLVLVVGKATKLTHRFNTQDKEYEGDMLLGIETATQDADGEIICEKDYSQVTQQQIRGVFSQYIGPQEQTPPMVSAKKVGGQPLYKLARMGLVVEREPSSINIFHLNINEINLPTISFSVKCSKGTYIRTLCYDIGRSLNCGAHLKSLRRTVSGNFNLTDAHAMSEIKTWNKVTLLEHCLSMDSLLSYV
jgi:tRNA pseudouridine55 synthase